ncbi:MAG: putative acetyltransferase, gnat family [Herbinix sp.]|nr:putative acetyltransferase, gnat family [Herbinix sp.]
MNEYFKSERLEYRPYQMKDLPTLVKLRNEQSRRRWFYFQEPDILTEHFGIKSIEDNILLWSRKIDILKEEAGLAIVLKETDELIGFIGLGKCRCNDVEIGYEIGEAFQNKGYATEAVRAAVSWGFARLQECNAELKIVGKVEHENWSSRRVLEKTGFTFLHAEKYLSVYELIN